MGWIEGYWEGKRFLLEVRVEDVTKYLDFDEIVFEKPIRYSHRNMRRH